LLRDLGERKKKEESRKGTKQRKTSKNHSWDEHDQTGIEKKGTGLLVPVGLLFPFSITVSQKNLSKKKKKKKKKKTARRA
jgi:hypothetical protein